LVRLFNLIWLSLIIPLELVKGLISECSQLKKAMKKEVITLWCSNIKLYDPILSISYYGIETIEYVDTNSKRSTQFKKGIKTVYFFLKTLINSSVIRKIKPLKRGLFEIVVFISTMAFNRKFTNPNFEKLNIALDNII
jgi:inner membrane protein